jgi:hypothetical protein
MNRAFEALSIAGLVVAAMVLTIFSTRDGGQDDEQRGDNFWLDETDAGYWASHPAG